MKRILLLATTTGYQTRMFGEAAERAGAKLVFATDRCDRLEDPWWDQAVPVRFHQEEKSVRAIVKATADAPVDGVLAVGDRPTVLAARAAATLGLPGHPVEAVRAAGNKLRARERFAAAGLSTPWFTEVSIAMDPVMAAAGVPYPCVLKPLVLSGSRGVIRADDEAGFVHAFERIARLLSAKDVQALRDPAAGTILVERYIRGDEFALEGVLDRGTLHTLAIFDKPDPLVGPFFEETIYVTPSSHPAAVQQAIRDAMAAACHALGLWHGPVHAECRVNEEGVWVLEVAARPIGGLCARALRFARPGGETMPLEEVLLRHALGEPVTTLVRETAASAVMMVPIPKRGLYRGVGGIEAARGVPGVDDVRITAKADQDLVPLPEGASYLGFVFARGTSPHAAVAAVRAAHDRLEFSIDTALPVMGVVRED